MIQESSTCKEDLVARYKNIMEVFREANSSSWCLLTPIPWEAPTF